MNASLEDLSKTIGYTFKDDKLLVAAVTHRSAKGENNERLEFLGDAVLGYVIAQWLFESVPDAKEGELSRRRAGLVKKETLAILARSLNLGDYLQLGSGELKTGGFRRDSILADAMEAVLGAIVLDSGFDACQGIIHQLYEEQFKELSSLDDRKDPKTCLQEFLQSRKLSLPEYTVMQVTGKPHDQHFVIECSVDDADKKSTGEGRSRRVAEQVAAERLLAELQTDV